MQESLEGIVSGPGLYIVEAPMGMGKTEAALHAAYQLMEKGDNYGLYFGLPTRMTSDLIHVRVNKFLSAAAGAHSRLVHGQAWLKGGGEEFLPGSAWFHPRKRALLSPFGVGTIDQALMSVLRVKHFFIRSFGLAGKVVILDEVHSYDVYTGTLLDELVKKLLEIGCTVIVLSATLTDERCRSFFHGEAIPEKTAYPGLTFRQKDGPVETIPVKPPPPRTVRVSMKPGECETESVENAVRRAGQGQCVLRIANTVADAQRWYRALKSRMQQDAFPVGLLHSRFPAYQRRKLEEKWMCMLGKNGDRPNGCVLTATQVVEQSVDIDSDYMITDIAPTDMILQRIGRLWRHERKNRPNQAGRGDCRNPRRRRPQGRRLRRAEKGLRGLILRVRPVRALEKLRGVVENQLRYDPGRPEATTRKDIPAPRTERPAVSCWRPTII